MKITLELWDDQSDANENDIDTTTWMFHLNGQPFPGETDCLMGLAECHRVACKLMDIEEITKL